MSFKLSLFFRTISDTQLVAEGTKARSDLQDAYTTLKKVRASFLWWGQDKIHTHSWQYKNQKAKDNRDKLLKEAIEAEESLAKTVKTNKDVSKVCQSVL